MKRIQSLSLRNSQYEDQEKDLIGEVPVKHSGNTDEHITDLVLELGIGENHREKWHLSMAVKPERYSYKWRRWIRNGASNMP